MRCKNGSLWACAVGCHLKCWIGDRCASDSGDISHCDSAVDDARLGRLMRTPARCIVEPKITGAVNLQVYSVSLNECTRICAIRGRSVNLASLCKWRSGRHCCKPGIRPAVCQETHFCEFNAENYRMEASWGICISNDTHTIQS